MEATPPNSQGASYEWIDGFSIFLLLSIALIALIDWLLGPNSRKNLLDKVGMWWLYIEDSDYSRLIKYDVELFINFIYKIFDFRTISKKRIASSLLFVTIGIIFTSILSINLFPNTPNFINLNAISIDFFVVLFLFFVNSITFSISLSISIYVISFTERYHNTGFLFIAFYFFIVLLDLIFAYFLFAISISLTGLIFSGGDIGFDMLLSVATGYLYPSEYITLSSIGFGSLIVSIAPTIMHFGFSIFLIINKLLSPILKWCTALLCRRIYEWQKGVLTTTAIALGALVKIVQATVKYLT